MAALSNLYGNVGKCRLCPNAMKPSKDSYANADEYWGWNQANKAEGYFRKGDYGSYGINHWISSPPSSFVAGWRGQLTWHWSTASAVKEASVVPVFGDCAWYGGNPFDLASKTPNGTPPKTRDWNKTSPKQWDYDMARFCMDRHNRSVNMAFVDGSSRSVRVNGLWDLQWHQQFRRASNVALAW